MFHKRGVVRKFDGRLDSVFFKNPPSLCLVWYAGHLITDHFAYIHHPSPNFPHNEYSKVKLSDLRLMWKPFQLLKEILKSLEKKSLESWIKLQTYWIVLLFLHPLRGGIMSKNTTVNTSTIYIHILRYNYNRKHKKHFYFNIDMFWICHKYIRYTLHICICLNFPQKLFLHIWAL